MPIKSPKLTVTQTRKILKHLEYARTIARGLEWDFYTVLSGQEDYKPTRPEKKYTGRRFRYLCRELDAANSMIETLAGIEKHDDES